MCIVWHHPLSQLINRWQILAARPTWRWYPSLIGIIMEQTYPDPKVMVILNETFQELESGRYPIRLFPELIRWHLSLLWSSRCTRHHWREMFLCSVELDLMTRSTISQQYLKCLISLKLAFCRMSPGDRIEMDSENPPFHIRLGIALDFYVLRKMYPRANILHPNCWSLCRNTCDINRTHLQPFITSWWHALQPFCRAAYSVISDHNWAFGFLI